MFQQLYFPFFQDDISKKEAEFKKKKFNPNRVFPEDITSFIDGYLPEYKEDLANGTLAEGMFRLPKLDPVHNVEPLELIPFNAVMSLPLSQCKRYLFFHFFVHDYQFERVWKNPQKYLPNMLRIGQGIGADFSMYLYMHPAEAILNCCRNRLLTFYLQKKGLTVIPNVCFGNEDTFPWVFDGLPEHSVLALTTQGCMRDNIAKRNLLNGLHELDRLKHPEVLYVYGVFPEVWKDKFKMEVKSLPTFSAKWRRAN